MRAILFIILVCIFNLFGNAQVLLNSGDKISYSNPKFYEIGGITVSGTKNLDKTAISLLSGLTIGDNIQVPGDDISQAIKSLWDQDLFGDVKIFKTKTQGDKIFLDIQITELPRLSRFKFSGVSKSEADDLREDIGLYKERIVNDNLVQVTTNTIQDYFVDKGFLNAEIAVRQLPDSIFFNHVLLDISVKKKKRVKISTIEITGNKALSDWQVRMNLKETKRKSSFRPFIAFDTLLLSSMKKLIKRDYIGIRDGVFSYFSDNVRLSIMKSSKFIEANYDADKAELIKKYNQKGYRDAQIIGDTITKDGNYLALKLNISEGNQYYFRNISWIGNTKYSTKELDNILGIEKGDEIGRAHV